MGVGRGCEIFGRWWWWKKPEMKRVDVHIMRREDLENIYEIEENFLGCGGFGKVRAAVRCCDGVKVAVKEVDRSDLPLCMMEDGLPMEVHLLHAVTGVPGVANIIDHFATSDSFFIIMQLVEGMDLFDFISQRAPLGEREAANLFKQVVKSVSECQKRGVMHGDVKTENVMVEDGGKNGVKIKIVDFGSGGWYCPSKIYSKYQGTRIFAPPEWVKFRKYRGEPLTVWSLGVLLYEMLCDRIPFETDMEILEGSIFFPQQLNLSSDVQNLIFSCLNRDQSARIGLMDILHHSWIA